MKLAKRTYKSSDGTITTHMVNPYDAEYTLCGLAFDCEIEHEGIEQIETREEKINCKVCASIIMGCKQVRSNQIEKEDKLIIP